ncbi:MAG: hypothetical protein R6V50_06145 [Thermoplasmatota archaeon]
MNNQNRVQKFSHIFFVSKEPSRSPFISDILSFGEKINTLSIKPTKIIISISFGNRLLIAWTNNEIKKLTQSDILEIVDVDPIKQNVLLIGQKEPCIETLVHWIIHKARNDINALVEIQSDFLYTKYSKKLQVLKKTPNGTIKRAKSILQTLQNTKNICIEDEGILLAGVYLKEIKDYLTENLGKST